MDVCRHCGGELSQGLDWCPRCYEPVPGRERATGFDLPPQIQRQMRERSPQAPPVYSRWRSGPTTFGPIGRMAETLFVIVAAVVGYPMTRGGILAAVGVDIPGTPFLIGYSILATIGAAYLFTRIWKRKRVA